LGERQPGEGEKDRKREHAMRGNENKDHRKDANMYSIERRIREEAGDCSGCSDLERGRSHKTEGRRVNWE
jgi:hypothetical protein